MEGTGRIWFTPQRLADIPRGRTDVCFRRKSGHRAGYASQRRWLEWTISTGSASWRPSTWRVLAGILH
jgi:hypothetical protein